MSTTPWTPWECINCGKPVRKGFVVCGQACADYLNAVPTHESKSDFPRLPEGSGGTDVGPPGKDAQ